MFMQNRQAPGFFIAGTDTGVGKTFMTTRFLKQFNQLGFRTIGIKPVASGCEVTAGGLRNDDALQLQAAASVDLPYELVNPITFEPPISPNLAAEFNNYSLTADAVVRACQPALEQEADIFLVEGAGGWLAPINDRETMADVAIQLGFPVILVVGLRLGCLNHTRLTVASMRASGVPIVGWVANAVDGAFEAMQENQDYLARVLGVPLLGCQSWGSTGCP